MVPLSAWAIEAWGRAGPYRAASRCLMHQCPDVHPGLRLDPFTGRLDPLVQPEGTISMASCPSLHSLLLEEHCSSHLPPAGDSHSLWAVALMKQGSCSSVSGGGRKVPCTVGSCLLIGGLCESRGALWALQTEHGTICHSYQASTEISGLSNPMFSRYPYISGSVLFTFQTTSSLLSLPQRFFLL